MGIIAAQSIGEPGTQLTMRTFHIGGTASKVAAVSEHHAKNAGVVRYHNLRLVENRDRDLVALNRNGEIAVEDDRGREKERYPVVAGAAIKVKEGNRVRPDELLVRWDPFTTPILTEVSGAVVFRDIVDDVTLASGPCPCGRGLPLWAHVEGRRFPLLRLPGGGRKSCQGIVLGMRRVGGCHQFQFVQRGDGRALVRVVPDATWSAGHAERARQMVRDEFGAPVDVEVEVRACLERPPGGKLKLALVESEEGGAA